MFILGGCFLTMFDDFSMKCDDVDDSNDAVSCMPKYVMYDIFSNFALNIPQVYVNTFVKRLI